MFQRKAVEKIKANILSETFFWKSYRLWDNVGKYGKTRQATGDNIRRKGIVYWVTKATDANSEYVILFFFPRQQWFRDRTSILCYT